MNGPEITRVVVTGASGGIGRAIAKRFCDEGATVANLDRADPSEAAALCGPAFSTIAVDLAAPDEITRAFAAVDTLFEGAPPDVLVCCAAMSVAAPLLSVTAADFDLQFDINVRGTFLAAQEAARRMKQVKRGQIVVITSVAAEQAWAGEPVYCMTKAAQRALVQALAVELAPFGIRANAVGPGIVDHPSRNMGRTRDEGGVLQHDLDRTPLGRFATPEEIAEAVAFAARAPWMTGQTIYVDGGFLAAGLAWFGSRKEGLK